MPVNVSGNVSTILGISVSSGIVLFTLAGFGVATPTPSYKNSSISVLSASAPINSDGSFSLQLHGNDTITPSGTVYLVQFITPFGVFGPFQYNITGVSNFNLTTATYTQPGVAPLPTDVAKLDVAQNWTGAKNTFVSQSVSTGVNPPLVIVAPVSNPAVSSLIEFGNNSLGAHITFDFDNDGSFVLRGTNGFSVTVPEQHFSALSVVENTSFTLNDFLIQPGIAKTGGNAILVKESAGKIYFQIPSTEGVQHPVGLQRVSPNLGTAYSGADAAIALSAGWGASGAVSAAVGFDQAFSFTVTASGTTTANPTITITFKDGTWTNIPQFIVLRNDTNSPFSTPPHTIAVTATTLTITFNGTPASGTSYHFICMGFGN